MFLFSPKFDWSFDHLFRFKWTCWTLPNCFYFAQMFLISPKTLLKFFSWPKFDEGCWNNHMIPVHSMTVFILPSGAKKNGKNSLRLFCRFVHCFAVELVIIYLSLDNRHHLTYKWMQLYKFPKFWKFLPE